MSASSTFSLLYQIQANGIEALDGVARKQQQISLETKYSSRELSEFDKILKDMTGDGTKLGRALEELSRSSAQFGRTNAQVAKDVLQNDRAMQASAKALADESEKAWKRVVEAQRKATAESKALAAESRRAGYVASSALGVSGGGIGQGIASLAGGGGGALLGIGAAVGALTSLYNITKETADFAQRQQNMATRMGGTTDQSQMMTRASQILDINPEAATTAMRGLVRAIADGGTESKRGEQALKALGVSATALGNGLISPATALEQMFTKLNAIKDPLEKDKLAMDLFQRTGLNILPLADGFDKLKGKIQDTGVIIDSDAIGKMVEYRQEVELLDLRWVALKEKLAQGVVATIKFAFPTAMGGGQTAAGGLVQSIIEGIIPGGTAAASAMRAYGALKDPGGPDVTGLTDKRMPTGNAFYDQMFAGNKASADSLLRSVDPKAYKSKQLADAQGDLDLAYSDRQKAVTGPQRTDAESRMRDAAARIAALSEKATSVLSELQRQIRDTVAGYNERSIGSDDPVQRLLIERDKKITDLQSNPRYQGFGSTLSQGVRQIRGAALGEILEAQTKQRDKEAKAQFLLDESMQKAGIANSKEFNRQGETDLRGVGLLGMPSDSIGIASPGLSAKQQNELSRIAVRGQSSIIGNTASTDTQALMQTIALRRQENDLIEQAAIIEANRFEGQAKQDELEKAAFDRRKADLDTEIELRTRIAEIGRQQKEETRSFSEGLFTAGMSGQSGGVSQYLHNFGMGLATKAIGNASDAILPSFNKVFSLGRTGALGTPDNPNFLGKLAKGTPFDFSAEELKKQTSKAEVALQAEKDKPLITSQDNLKRSIDDLTAAIGGKTTSGGGSFSGSTTSGAGVFGGLSRILRGPGGTAPFAGGSSGSLSDLIQDGLNIPLSATAGHSADVSAIASLVATQSANVAGGYSLVGTSSFGIPNGTSGGSAAAGTSAISKISGGLGQLFGGASTIFGGHALQGIFTGGMDNGDGTGQALSGLGRVGAAAGLAGGTYAGISGAISGFGQGGGRGITKGIGSALGTASMYDPEPISHAVLQTGAAIAGIVSSMFGDPVANRQKAIDQALTNDQYVQPNAHNYSYSGSGGGVDFGADGSMRGGAKQAGYTVNVSAMDAKSLYDTLQRNGQAFGTNLAQSIGSSGVGALASEVSWHALHP